MMYELKNIAFDQYQRYKNVALLINGLRGERQSFKILEVGANEHQNLEKFLLDDQVIYLDIKLPKHLQKLPNYVLGDATKMEFENNEFDIVVALDVFEHIPNDRKEKFIEELDRVSKEFFIFCAPFDSKEAKFSETAINSVYRTLTGTDYIWLDEHKQLGLPILKKTINKLIDLKIDYAYFGHGDINIWERIFNIHFTAVLDERLVEYRKIIDRYYNEFIFPFDYRDKDVYRYFIIGKIAEDKVSAVLDQVRFNDSKDKNKSYEHLDFLINEFNFLAMNRFLQKQNENNSEIMNAINDNLSKIPAILDNQLLFSENLIQPKPDDSIREYFDYGDGFTEEKSILLKNLEENNEITVKLKKNMKAVRIDAGEKKCLLKIMNFVSNYPKDYFQIETNGTKISEDLYLYIINDPQFIINNLNSIEDDIHINFKVCDYNEMSNEVFFELIKARELLAIKEEELANKNIDISNKENEIENRYEEIRSKDEEIKSKDDEIRNKAEVIRSKDEKIKNKDDEIKNKDEELKNKDKKINEIINKMNKKEKELISKNQKLKEFEQNNQDLCMQLENHQHLLEQERMKYNCIINSKSWKISEPLRKIADKFKGI